jgi:hypothetical protein
MREKDTAPGGKTSYGRCPDDAALRAAWGEFCDRLKAAGDLVFKDYNPPTPLQRADGFRYLAQNLGQAFDLALEIRDTRYPALYPFCSPTRKLGSDNADCVYLQAWIDGESVYKISGNRGGARMSNIAVQGQRRADAYGTGQTRPLHDPFGDAPEANIFGHELVTNWDGTFELYVGGEKRGPNWLPTTKESRKLFLRQYFDSFDEPAAEYRIERVDMVSPRPMPTPPQLIEAMHWAGQFVYDVVDYWPDWLFGQGEFIDPDALNQFHGQNMRGRSQVSAEAAAVDRRRGRLGTMMRWRLAPDEALIIEFDTYDGFWMIDVESVFGNSMDFLYREVSYSPSRAAVDPDGKVRLVLTKDDPGYANWLDNQGFTDGAVTFRNVMVATLPELRTQVVKAAELVRHMPADSHKCTPEKRAANLQRRFDAIRRRYRI